MNLLHNGRTSKMELTAPTCRVRADGRLLTCDPATVLPMPQKQVLF